VGATISERVLDANGLRLACRLWGEPSGVPTLALHGWLDNAASFDALAVRLPELQLCALDLPGHGLSEHRPPGASYHFVDYVPDVLAAADALGWPRFALMGHSLGAGIATLLAAVAPERVLRVVLIEGLGPAASPPEDAPAVLRRALAESQRAGRPARTLYPTFEDAVQARMHGIGKLSAPAARVLCQRGLEHAADGYRWRNDRRLYAGSRLRMSEAQVLAFVREMSVPTLLIRAEPGLATDPRAQQARIDTHPDLRVERIPGSHHLHMEDQCARVAELIGAFIVNRSTAPAAGEGL
jgi:pimeloyl-ACP methyl ester carboxylesterase